ncbi:Gcv operon activator [Providencia alcalifaciens]|nr:Gcv operon activator [Providencia alcalifaciens]
MPLLVPSSRPNVWQTWQSRSGINLQKNKRISFEHFYLCLQAALAGQGAAIASFLMVADEIETKQLIAPEGFIEGWISVLFTFSKRDKREYPCRNF